MKGTIGIDNHRGLKVNLKEGVIDFGETNYQVNTYHIDKFHKGVGAEFLNELVAAMKGTKWYNNTNAMIDYFDIAYYVYINIGKWDNPYVVLKEEVCIMNEKVETWLCGIMFTIGMGVLPIFLVW